MSTTAAPPFPAEATDNIGRLAALDQGDRLERETWLTHEHNSQKLPLFVLQPELVQRRGAASDPG